MDRVPPLTILAALLALGGGGCLSADKAQAKYTSLKRTVGLETPEPATEVLSFWQRRLATLNDPTRDGMMVAGLVGQVFLISPSSKAAEATGDLTVAVYDVTARPQGRPERTPEVYHLDPARLAQLATKDERFGPCYAIFLPWPPEWTDVTNVKIMTRYDAPGGTALHGREVLVQLEAERAKLTWEEKNFQKVGGPMPPMTAPAAPDRRGVPDPLKVLAAMRGKTAAAPPVAAAKLPPPEAFMRSNVPVTDASLVAAPAPGGPVMTTVDRTPLVTTQPNTVNSSYSTGGAYAGPKPGAAAAATAATVNGPVQPIIIRRE